ncbi:MAG: hypothetical protein LBT40_15900 [Deltaproteobacteria bacterium]|jgi:hypothetical protein|nr:hypothetical protein [Deltaproteobacteria bacterium]
MDDKDKRELEKHGILLKGIGQFRILDDPDREVDDPVRAAFRTLIRKARPPRLVLPPDRKKED